MFKGLYLGLYLYGVIVLLSIIVAFFLGLKEETEKRERGYLIARVLFSLILKFRVGKKAAKLIDSLEVYRCDACEDFIVGRPKNLAAPAYICIRCEQELENIASGKPMSPYEDEHE